jgi:hypothetical protein
MQQQLQEAIKPTQKSNTYNWNFILSIFPASIASQGIFKKDPTVWLDWVRSPPIGYIDPALA